MEKPNRILITPEVKALIGKKSEVVEMYGEVDRESVRRYVHGIPDQDPRHWDEELAKPRFGGTSAPPLLLSFVGFRKPPWEADNMDEVMAENPVQDDGGGMMREGASLLDLREVTGTTKHLHAGDEVEVYRYPKLGDKIFFQQEVKDIQEKVGRRGEPFLLITQETRYWNQDNEVICVVRTLGAER
jgi:acyl dehydratase